jgi:hypothetical protein
MEQANQAFNLGFKTSDEVAALSTPDGEDPELVTDITKHPQFAELATQISGLRELVESNQEAQENSRQQEEFDRFLKQKHEDETYGSFDDKYVTALMSTGMTFEQAFDQYSNLATNLLKPNENGTEQAGSGANGSDNGAPVVMGGDGAGSGNPQQPISFGSMKTGDLTDVVNQYLENAAKEE